MHTRSALSLRAQHTARRLQMTALGIACIAASFSLGIRTAGEMETVAHISADSLPVPGDITSDGKRDLRDAIAILELLRDGTLPTAAQLQSDPDADGTLTIHDALLILTAVADQH